MKKVLVVCMALASSGQASDIGIDLTWNAQQLYTHLKSINSVETLKKEKTVLENNVATITQELTKIITMLQRKQEECKRFYAEGSEYTKMFNELVDKVKDPSQKEIFKQALRSYIKNTTDNTTAYSAFLTDLAIGFNCYDPSMNVQSKVLVHPILKDLIQMRTELLRGLHQKNMKEATAICTLRDEKTKEKEKVEKFLAAYNLYLSSVTK